MGTPKGALTRWPLSLWGSIFSGTSHLHPNPFSYSHVWYRGWVLVVVAVSLWFGVFGWVWFAVSFLGHEQSPV